MSATRAGDFRLRHAVLLESERDVLLDGHVREQRVGLEHHVHRSLVRRNARHVGAIDQDFAAGGLFESRQHAQQRGLAAARAAEQAEQLLLVDLQRDVVDRDKVTKFLGDPINGDVGTACGSFQSWIFEFRAVLLVAMNHRNSCCRNYTTLRAT